VLLANFMCDLNDTKVRERPERGPTGVASPYPGLRPYERSEQSLFFGRDRDAELLANKVLAAPVTLLFGQSGRGKSSLLRALLGPQLEDEGTRVFIFDGWAAEDPVAALAEKLTEAASENDEKLASGELSRPSPSERATSVLVRLVRRLSAYDPRPLVLVLDQFEELLLRHGHHIEPMRREIAALVRDERVECRLLISLREEFLAALEPFRRDVPRLFDSTFRVEALSPAALRAAIARPPKQFGVTVEPELVDVLLHDLASNRDRSDTLAESSGTPVLRKRLSLDESVELPILQLVLSELWRSAHAAGAPAMTVAHYRAIGGAAKVRADYVASVMPTERRGRLVTARLLRYLAPPSGYKASFSTEDLASLSDLSPATIAAELSRLSVAGILRVREFRDRRLFELQHDALIDVLTPWREAVLGADRQRRWRLRAGAITAAVVLLVAAAAYLRREADLRDFNFRQEMAAALEGQRRRELEGQLAKNMNTLRAMSAEERGKEAPSLIDEGVRILLASSNDSSRLDLLASVLKANEDLIPACYGYRLTCAEIAPPPENWPYVIEFAPRRRLLLNSDPYEEEIDIRERLFRLYWQEQAKYVSKTWGYPVPTQIRFRANPSLPARRVRLLVGTREVVAIDIALREGQPSIATSSLKGELASEFYKRFGADWPITPEFARAGEYRAVPRWTLPVWKMTAESADHYTSAIALALLSAVIANPQELLIDGTPLLLDRNAGPTTDEAIAARGRATLAMDLGGLVKSGVGIVHLPMILDALALYRAGERSEDIVGAVGDDLTESYPTIPAGAGLQIALVPTRGPEQAAPALPRQGRRECPHTIASRRASPLSTSSLPRGPQRPLLRTTARSMRRSP
jgi:hypothetical protein